MYKTVIDSIAHLKGEVTRDDSQRRFLAQNSVTLLEQCCNHSKQCRNNDATLCCAKSEMYGNVWSTLHSRQNIQETFENKGLQLQKLETSYTVDVLCPIFKFFKKQISIKLYQRALTIRFFW